MIEHKLQTANVAQSWASAPNPAINTYPTQHTIQAERPQGAIPFQCAREVPGPFAANLVPCNEATTKPPPQLGSLSDNKRLGDVGIPFQINDCVVRVRYEPKESNATGTPQKDSLPLEAVAARRTADVDRLQGKVLSQGVGEVCDSVIAQSIVCATMQALRALSLSQRLPREVCWKKVSFAGFPPKGSGFDKDSKIFPFLMLWGGAALHNFRKHLN